MMRMRSQEDLNDLIALLLVSTSGTGFRRARERLLQQPAEDVVPALIAARGRSMQDARAFDRCARLLAQIGGDEAFSALSEHVRTSRRFPEISIRALAQCDDPRAFHELVELIRLPSPQPYGVEVGVTRLSTGNRKKQEAAIRYLGRAGHGRAVAPLCFLAGQRRGFLAHHARRALIAMGRPEALARMVLAYPALTVPERVHGLVSISGVWRFDPQRFLDREARRLDPFAKHNDPVISIGSQAAICAAALRERNTLLRPSEHMDHSTLLRAASGHGTNGHEELLRASDRPVEGASPDRAAWWRRMVRAMTGRQ